MEEMYSSQKEDKSKESQDTTKRKDDNEPKYTIKDSVFRHLFLEPKYALQLYSVLHPEDTRVTEEDIVYLTLIREITNGIRNDLGMYIKGRYLILIEAQTTWSLNILIRMFIYLAETWKNYIVHNDLDIFSSKVIELPVPELYVVYTGNRKTRPKYLKLSEDIFHGVCKDVELTIQVLYNGKNEGDILDQYVSFTEKVDDLYKEYGRTKEAAEKLLEYCMENDILREYLQERREEVRGMMDVIFDDRIHRSKSPEQLEQEAYEAEIDEARWAGEKSGKNKKARETAIELAKIGMEEKVIARVLKVSITQVESWLQMEKIR